VVDEDKKNAVRLTDAGTKRDADDLPFLASIGPGRGMPAGRGMGMMPPSTPQMHVCVLFAH